MFGDLRLGDWICSSVALLAGDHRGLPPALIQVGEHDPLREDGARYATALRSAGVPVRFTEYVGMPHGYLNFPGICRSARQALAEICAEQSAALTPRASPITHSAKPDWTIKPDNRTDTGPLSRPRC